MRAITEIPVVAEGRIGLSASRLPCSSLQKTAIKGLNHLANRHCVQLRQLYLRIAKRAALMAGRYAHAKQFNRYRRELRLLRVRLGRIVRDIARKVRGTVLELVFHEPLAWARQIRSQGQGQRGFKIYSFHAPPRLSASARARPAVPTSSASRRRSSPPTRAE